MPAALAHRPQGWEQHGLSRWVPDQGRTLGQWREVTRGDKGQDRPGCASVSWERVQLSPRRYSGTASATIPGGAVPPPPVPRSKGSFPAAEL